MELRLTDNTQQAIAENFPLSPEALAKLNFALSLSGTTHAVESLQTHCELSLEDAETLAVALHLLSKVNFSESMLSKPRKDSVPGQQSTNTLYIRNLPLNVTQEELSVAFENYGTVKEIRIQKEKSTGEFFGSVFVEYVHASAAKLAQIQMDGKLWGINTVHVSFAKEKNTSTVGDGSLPQLQQSILTPTSVSGGNSASIFVAGLAPETDAPALRLLFSRFGEISDSRILTDKATGQTKGVGFVDFVLPLSAAAAIDSMNNQIHNGRSLKVSYATQKSKTNQQPGALTIPFPSSGYPDGYMGYPQMGIHSYY